MEVNLELLGLNKYESQAYEALVRLGKSGAYGIARESGVPYGRIYDTLHSLAAKGLVKIIPEKSKKFVAASPEILEQLLARKLGDLQKLQTDVQNMKKLYTESGEEPVEIVKGKRNFYKLAGQLPQPTVYDYDFKYSAEVAPAKIREARRRLRQGVKYKVLTRYDAETKANVDEWKRLVPKLEIKKFPCDKVTGDVIDDKIVLLALVESNTSILIRDIPFAKFMKRLFEAAWEKAEKI